MLAPKKYGCLLYGMLRLFDSVMQGLGAPAGSIVAGPRPFIERVHRMRKMLGGGMRQVGVLAAPGQPPALVLECRYYLLSSTTSAVHNKCTMACAKCRAPLWLNSFTDVVHSKIL